MKINILICLAVIIAGFICCAKKPASTAAVSVTSTVEWGTSYTGDTIRVEIPCVNKGNSDAVIDYINTPCGCITAIPRKYVIKQGDSTVIDIMYSPTDAGYTEKNMFLFLRNVEDPILFTIRGRIKKQQIR